MAAVAGILFTDLVGLGNWWEAGANVQSSFDLKTLIIIEVGGRAGAAALRPAAGRRTGCRAAQQRCLEGRLRPAARPAACQRQCSRRQRCLGVCWARQREAPATCEVPACPPSRRRALSFSPLWQVVTFAILEGFRVKAYEKTGEVRGRHPVSGAGIPSAGQAALPLVGQASRATIPSRPAASAQ